MLNSKFLNKMKKNLLEQRRLISTHQKVPHDIDVDGDETDEIQGKMIIELASQLNIRNNEKINKIDEALRKIDDKTYGLCEDCGDEIAEKRLQLSPYSLTCIFCAEEREIINKQRKRV